MIVRSIVRACLALGITLASLNALARGGAQPAGQSSGQGTLVGTWSFDGRTSCKSGRAWIFSDDGSYSEVLLPDRHALAKGRWSERGSIIHYSLARPGAQSDETPLNKRMDVVERLVSEVEGD